MEERGRVRDLMLHAQIWQSIINTMRILAISLPALICKDRLACRFISRLILHILVKTLRSVRVRLGESYAVLVYAHRPLLVFIMTRFRDLRLTIASHEQNEM